jgi:uncharacterized protein YbjQ (UPF0145 family)
MRTAGRNSLEDCRSQWYTLDYNSSQTAAGIRIIQRDLSSQFTKLWLCEKTRAKAFDMMVLHAEEVGANAVIGIRYDANEVMSGVTEVLCCGTAVTVEPERK